MAERTGGLRVAVTGAAGYIGRAVVERLDRGAIGAISCLRLNDVQACTHPRAEIVQGSYTDAETTKRLVGDELDILFHLASLPGGAAERDFGGGRRVNLDGSIALIDAVAVAGRAPVVVYTSTIAALGHAHRPVDAQTPLRPTGSYGTHKAMIEFYLADLTRRGVVDGRAVRPAGVVARPRDAYAGFATAWMSDLFHAAIDGRAIAVPVRATAHIWLQSIDRVADNVVRAALIPAAGLPSQRVWTLPATVVRVGALVAALERRTGRRLAVDYGDAPTDQPPLDSTEALAVGFVSDGDVDALVDAVVSRIKRNGDALADPNIIP